MLTRSGRLSGSKLFIPISLQDKPPLAAENCKTGLPLLAA